MMRVVVGVDGSDEGWAAFDRALEVVDPAGEVVLVHADYLPVAAAFGIASSLDLVVEAEDQIRAEIDRVTAERSSEGGPALRVEIVKGRPVDALLNTAKRLDADLVVVGHRGSGGALSWIGSTANGVVHRATVSVLVAR